MTGSVKEAAEPSALLGDWRLDRQLRDERAGLSGTASGHLTLRPEGSKIMWREQGTLLWNGSQLPFSRCYLLRRVEGQWWLHFGDGRPFHPWTPGEWVHHPCSEDAYHGLITIDGPDDWHTRWDVRGPATHRLISTQFRRSSYAGVGCDPSPSQRP